MVWLALVAAAFATQVTATRVPCPLDATEQVRVFEKLASDTHGGWDSDLAAYSSRGQWREYAVSTCPESLYSAYGRDMGAELSDADKAAARARLTQLRVDIGDPGGLEVWDRYLIAAELYTLRGMGPRFLSQLYLEASWTARDEAVGVYIGLEGPVAARGLLTEGTKELQRSDLDAHTRKILLHNLARVAHRGGYAEERDAFLDQFEAVGGLTAEEKAVLDRFRFIVNDVEPKLQALAVEQLRAFIATQPSDTTELMRATYLLGDLARRNGRPEEAVAMFAVVIQADGAPANLRELAAFLGAEIDLPE